MQMRVKDILKVLELWAPPSYQESYDNTGLLIGNREDAVSGVLVTLDVTMEVLEEAIANNCNLIVAHHPLIFKGIKQMTPTHWVQKCIIKAVKHDLSVYAVHTNLDNVVSGVNWKIAELLDLESVGILSPKSNTLLKLVTFAPSDAAQSVLNGLYAAGAGEIGNYDHCSFQTSGVGSFRPNEKANPTIGTIDQDESVEESRLEVLLPKHRQSAILGALKKAHPYEEVAYYLHPLTNQNQEVGSGAIGNLREPLPPGDFINILKQQMKLDVVKCTPFVKKEIQKVAVCGGAGGFLLGAAKRAGADVFVSSDFKYHEFFEAEEDIIVADIGHYESEVFTKDLIGERLRENFANIALRLSQVDTNPIKYL